MVRDAATCILIMAAEKALCFGEVEVRMRSDWKVGIGGSTWTCGEQLCEYLWASREHYLGRRLQVAELGSGTGLVGLYFARLVPSARVVLTDLADHVDLLKANMALNGLGNASAEALDWCAKQDIASFFEDSYDLVLATDCAYHERLHDPLVAALAAACSSAHTIALFGATRSDTSQAFFDKLVMAGLEYLLLDDRGYFGLFEIRRRVDFWDRIAPVASMAGRIAEPSAWTQCASSKVDVAICHGCARDLFVPDEWLDAAAAMLSAVKLGGETVCECGAVYCSPRCRRANSEEHLKLCVGQLDENSPLFQLKLRMAELSDGNDDTLSLSLAWIARSDGACFDISNHEVPEKQEVSLAQDLWGLMVQTSTLATAGRSSYDLARVLSMVRMKSVEVTRPHPLVRLCRDEYLGQAALSDTLRIGLTAWHRPLVEERCAEELGFEKEICDDDALQWILASPDEFFEPVRVLCLAFFDVPHSCAPTCQVVWAQQAPFCLMLKLERRLELGGAETLLWDDSSETCGCTLCKESDWSHSLREADARVDERWDDLEALLLTKQHDPAASYELWRLSSWRGNWTEATLRLQEAHEAYPDDPAILKAHSNVNSYFPEVAPSRTVHAADSNFSTTTYLDNRIFVAAALLDSADCARMVACAEQHAARVGWSTSRHYAVPTTDISVSEIPPLLDWFNDQLATIIFPFVASCFATCSPDDLRVVDAFFVKYSSEAQRHLPLHTDQSDFSLTVAMNDRSNYRGGGTYFPSLSRHPLSVDAGGLVAFDGTLLHAGFPLLQGTRYIITVFLSSNSSLPIS